MVALWCACSKSLTTARAVRRGPLISDHPSSCNTLTPLPSQGGGGLNIIDLSLSQQAVVIATIPTPTTNDPTTNNQPTIDNLETDPTT